MNGICGIFKWRRIYEAAIIMQHSLEEENMFS